jgi:hypothetical protein
MNLLTGIGFYAATCKELGEPFVFPGNDLSWNAEYDHSSVSNDADFQVYHLPHASSSSFSVPSICMDTHSAVFGG